MPATYEPIASTSLASVSTATFTSISGTFTDLRLVVYLGATSSGHALRLRFNSDSGTNYSATTLYGNGSSAGSQRYSNIAYFAVGQNVYTRTGAAIAYEIDIQSYASTSVFKTGLSKAVNQESSEGYVDRTVSLWRSTSAITAIELYASNGTNFATGSTAALYGIKASA